jgi:hypothetical protein
MNDGLHQQALRIDQDVPLLALDFLSCIDPEINLETAVANP